ncbi:MULTISPECIES: PadR family transcriptional regulator [Rhizobium]|nr:MULTISPECIES: helix-turn-helix transcriptional regulator [Rhizobium]
MAKDVRLTTQTISVLQAVMAHRVSGASGAVIAKETGLASGSLYPILKRLEDAGWLSSEWEKGDPSELGRPRRRFYNVTGMGARKMNAIATTMSNDLEDAAWAF